jgi:penicillin-insensitive murein endopeptidase
MRTLLAGVCLLGAGCFGTPTPLAPNVRGSVGEPHRGVLTEAMALPQSGLGFKRLRDDDVRWGNPRLVNAVMRAAMAVARSRPGGEPLVIGDLSAKRGGSIPNHRSHRTGRDADLLFYAVTPDGRSIENTGFVRFGKDGLALARHHPPKFVRIDVPRTWILVRELVNDEEAAVQHLFVARWLEALLIEHALARGESDVTLLRAATVMREPGDSFVHDDHIHLRIGCIPAEIVQGCVPGGSRPAPTDGASDEPDEQLVAALFEDPHAIPAVAAGSTSVVTAAQP